MNTTVAPEEPDFSEMTLDDVLRWILDNSEDEKAMEKINKVSFPFTPFYKKRGE